MWWLEQRRRQAASFFHFSDMYDLTAVGAKDFTRLFVERGRREKYWLQILCELFSQIDDQKCSAVRLYSQIVSIYPSGIDELRAAR